MGLPEHIAAQMDALDPSGRAVVMLVWHIHEQQSEELKRLREEGARRDARLAELQAQNDKLKHMLFGTRSEKIPPVASEVRRAVEAEELTIDVPADATNEEQEAARTKARRVRGRSESAATREKRRKDLTKLPVVHETILVRPEDLPLGTELSDFRPLGDGQEVRRIEHVREHLVVMHYQLQRLVERGGERIVQASTPANVIDGGLWGPSVYAHVVVQKCVDSMPLYRISKALGRGSYEVARSVLCGLFHRAAEVLVPIYDRLVALAAQAPYLHADETRLRVAEPKKARNAWVWALVCRDIVAYVFSESRSGDTPARLLEGTSGHLLVDGYSGYNSVLERGTGDSRTRVGCWAHARRYFWEALKDAPAEARTALDFIVALYRVEHDAAGLGILGLPEHGNLRDTRSRAIIEEFHGWADARLGSVPPKSPLGQALGYASKQRKALTQFLADPKLPLDNNVAERALRVVAIGRKNFLFVGHDEGGKNLAILQTLCHTAMLHGLNPYAYIQDVVVRVRSHPHACLDELLPQNWKPPPRT
jgi:transposase